MQRLADVECFGVDDEEDGANVAMVSADSYDSEQKDGNTPEIDL